MKLASIEDCYEWINVIQWCLKVCESFWNFNISAEICPETCSVLHTRPKTR